MNFNQWFEQLQTRTGQNPGAGLAVLKEVLAKLGSPHECYPVIHVAGTNGKGTVCALLARGMSRAGKKTGLFVSPHLISPTERIQIDNASIPPEDFRRVIEKVLAVSSKPLNFFELLTAAAFVYFAEKKVQFAVLETGLGGRKDPTNVCNPVLTIITSIGLDHTRLLGENLEKIATEKAGIIKPGVPVICGYLPPEAARVVKETARQKNAPLKMISKAAPLGSAQAQNVHLVSWAAEALGMKEDFLSPAFDTPSLPGRFEIFQVGEKTIILDGAHNPPAIENLLAFYQTTPFAKQSTAVLCGFMKDKDYPRMMAALATYFKAGVISCAASPRAAGEKDVARFLPSTWKFVPDLPAALTHACQQAEVVLVTGSFYVAGAVRAILVKERNALSSSSKIG